MEQSGRQASDGVIGFKALRSDLDRVAVRDRWGIALILMGWVHLAAFAACHRLHESGDRTPGHYLPIWIAEAVACVALIRSIAGPHWHQASPMAGLVARIWGTFLILSFNLASMNTLSGLDHEWFKPVLCTLSAFGFAMMGYLVHVRFFFPAVVMYLTGLLMVLNLDRSYLIYGISWWGILQGIGGTMQYRRLRWLAGTDAARLRPAATFRPTILGADPRWN